MKVELFPFQKTALARLRQSVATALGNYRSTHTPQVVSYTAPTGAGKTIVMSALIEAIYYGDDLYPDQNEAIFIWLSDSPQLNEQSRLKIDLKADKIRLNQCVTISDDCQLCHDTCSSFEATEIFLKPETELDPVNLCLCPNCAAAYRKLRTNTEIMDNVRRSILTMKDSDIENGDYVTVSLDDDDELWFTQTHFAEIRELMKLAEEVKQSKQAAPAPASVDDEGEKSGILIHNLKHKDSPKDPLTPDEVEILTVPSDLAEYKSAITEALYKGTKRNIESEADPKNVEVG